MIYLAKTFNSLFGVRSVRLDASTYCQLKCPSCPTGKGFHEKGVVGKGFLSYEHFKQFVDNNPKVRHIELSNYGEIFLNPELYEIFQYAFQKKVHLTAFNGVNFNYVKDEVLEALVKYKVKGLTLSIDGASDETYSIYRKNGNFSQIIRNIERLNQFKEKYRSRWPILRWQFILFGHNEHELTTAKSMAKQLKTYFCPRFNWDESYSPVENKEKARQAINNNIIKKNLGGGVENQESSRQNQPSVAYCTQFWCQPQVNWDGKLFGCCVNHFCDYGNVFSEGLGKLMAQEQYQDIKDVLFGKIVPDKDCPCFSCTLFQQLYPRFERENPSKPYT